MFSHCQSLSKANLFLKTVSSRNLIITGLPSSQMQGRRVLALLLQRVRLFYFYCSVHSPSCVRLFVTPWTTAHQASLSITNSQSLLKFMSIESVMPSNHLILCCPPFLLPSIFPSIRVFSNESVLQIGWPKYWSFSFSISPSNEYSGLISFKIDWLDLLAVQGTCKSFFPTLKASIQKHSKASVQKHQFFGTQLSL